MASREEDQRNRKSASQSEDSKKRKQKDDLHISMDDNYDFQLDDYTNDAFALHLDPISKQQSQYDSLSPYDNSLDATKFVFTFDAKRHTTKVHAQMTSGQSSDDDSVEHIQFQSMAEFSSSDDEENDIYSYNMETYDVETYTDGRELLDIPYVVYTQDDVAEPVSNDASNIVPSSSSPSSTASLTPKKEQKKRKLASQTGKAANTIVPKQASVKQASSTMNVRSVPSRSRSRQKTNLLSSIINAVSRDDMNSNNNNNNSSNSNMTTRPIMKLPELPIESPRDSDTANNTPLASPVAATRALSPKTFDSSNILKSILKSPNSVKKRRSVIFSETIETAEKIRQYVGVTDRKHVKANYPQFEDDHLFPEEPVIQSVPTPPVPSPTSKSTTINNNNNTKSSTSTNNTSNSTTPTKRVLPSIHIPQSGRSYSTGAMTRTLPLSPNSITSKTHVMNNSKSPVPSPTAPSTANKTIISAFGSRITTTEVSSKNTTTTTTSRLHRPINTKFQRPPYVSSPTNKAANTSPSNDSSNVSRNISNLRTTKNNNNNTINNNNSNNNNNNNNGRIPLKKDSTSKMTARLTESKQAHPSISITSTSAHKLPMSLYPESDTDSDSITLPTVMYNDTTICSSMSDFVPFRSNLQEHFNEVSEYYDSYYSSTQDDETEEEESLYFSTDDEEEQDGNDEEEEEHNTYTQEFSKFSASISRTSISSKNKGPMIYRPLLSDEILTQLKEVDSDQLPSITPNDNNFSVIDAGFSLKEVSEPMQSEYTDDTSVTYASRSKSMVSMTRFGLVSQTGEEVFDLKRLLEMKDLLDEEQRMMEEEMEKLKKNKKKTYNDDTNYNSQEDTKANHNTLQNAAKNTNLTMKTSSFPSLPRVTSIQNTISDDQTDYAQKLVPASLLSNRDSVTVNMLSIDSPSKEENICVDVTVDNVLLLPEYHARRCIDVDPQDVILQLNTYPEINQAILDASQNAIHSKTAYECPELHPVAYAFSSMQQPEDQNRLWMSSREEDDSHKSRLEDRLVEWLSNCEDPHFALTPDEVQRKETPDIKQRGQYRFIALNAASACFYTSDRFCGVSTERIGEQNPLIFTDWKKEPTLMQPMTHEQYNQNCQMSASIFQYPLQSDKPLCSQIICPGMRQDTPECYLSGKNDSALPAHMASIQHLYLVEYARMHAREIMLRGCVFLRFKPLRAKSSAEKAVRRVYIRFDASLAFIHMYKAIGAKDIDGAYRTEDPPAIMKQPYQTKYYDDYNEFPLHPLNTASVSHGEKRTACSIVHLADVYETIVYNGYKFAYARSMPTDQLTQVAQGLYGVTPEDIMAPDATTFIPKEAIFREQLPPTGDSPTNSAHLEVAVSESAVSDSQPTPTNATHRRGVGIVDIGHPHAQNPELYPFHCHCISRDLSFTILTQGYGSLFLQAPCVITSIIWRKLVQAMKRKYSLPRSVHDVIPFQDCFYYPQDTFIYTRTIDEMIHSNPDLEPIDEGNPEQKKQSQLQQLRLSYIKVPKLDPKLIEVIGPNPTRVFLNIGSQALQQTLHVLRQRHLGSGDRAGDSSALLATSVLYDLALTPEIALEVVHNCYNCKAQPLPANMIHPKELQDHVPISLVRTNLHTQGKPRTTASFMCETGFIDVHTSHTKYVIHSDVAVKLTQEMNSKNISRESLALAHTTGMLLAAKSSQTYYHHLQWNLSKRLLVGGNYFGVHRVAVNPEFISLLSTESHENAHEHILRRPLVSKPDYFYLSCNPKMTSFNYAYEKATSVRNSIDQSYLCSVQEGPKSPLYGHCKHPITLRFIATDEVMNSLGNILSVPMEEACSCLSPDVHADCSNCTYMPCLTHGREVAHMDQHLSIIDYYTYCTWVNSLRWCIWAQLQTRFPSKANLASQTSGVSISNLCASVPAVSDERSNVTLDAVEFLHKEAISTLKKQPMTPNIPLDSCMIRKIRQYLYNEGAKGSFSFAEYFRFSHEIGQIIDGDLFLAIFRPLGVPLVLKCVPMKYPIYPKNPVFCYSSIRKYDNGTEPQPFEFSLIRLIDMPLSYRLFVHNFDHPNVQHYICQIIQTHSVLEDFNLSKGFISSPSPVGKEDEEMEGNNYCMENSSQSPGYPPRKEYLTVVMEYGELGTQGFLLQKTQLYTEAHIAFIAYSLLRGLLYCHSKGLIHNDIKTENVVVNCRGQLKLADLSSSLVMKDIDKYSYVNGLPGDTTPPVWVPLVQVEIDETKDDPDGILNNHGTLLWNAPEKFLPDYKVNACTAYRGDVWSLGILLLEILNNCVPPNNRYKHSLDIAAAILQRPVPRLLPLSEDNEASSYEVGGAEVYSESYTPLIADFIASCLIKDPHYRPNPWQLLGHPLLTNFVGKVTLDNVLYPQGETFDDWEGTDSNFSSDDSLSLTKSLMKNDSISFPSSILQVLANAEDTFEEDTALSLPKTHKSIDTEHLSMQFPASSFASSEDSFHVDVLAQDVAQPILTLPDPDIGAISMEQFESESKEILFRGFGGIPVQSKRSSLPTILAEKCQRELQSLSRKFDWFARAAFRPASPLKGELQSYTHYSHEIGARPTKSVTRVVALPKYVKYNGVYVLSTHVKEPVVPPKFMLPTCAAIGGVLNKDTKFSKKYLANKGRLGQMSTAELLKMRFYEPRVFATCIHHGQSKYSSIHTTQEKPYSGTHIQTPLIQSNMVCANNLWSPQSSSGLETRNVYKGSTGVCVLCGISHFPNKRSKSTIMKALSENRTCLAMRQYKKSQFKTPSPTKMTFSASPTRIKMSPKRHHNTVTYEPLEKISSDMTGTLSEPSKQTRQPMTLSLPSQDTTTGMEVRLRGSGTFSEKLPVRTLEPGKAVTADAKKLDFKKPKLKLNLSILPPEDHFGKVTLETPYNVPAVAQSDKIPKKNMKSKPLTLDTTGLGFEDDYLLYSNKETSGESIGIIETQEISPEDINALILEPVLIPSQTPKEFKNEDVTSINVSVSKHSDVELVESSHFHAESDRTTTFIPIKSKRLDLFTSTYESYLNGDNIRVEEEPLIQIEGEIVYEEEADSKVANFNTEDTTYKNSADETNILSDTHADFLSPISLEEVGRAHSDNSGSTTGGAFLPMSSSKPAKSKSLSIHTEENMPRIRFCTMDVHGIDLEESGIEEVDVMELDNEGAVRFLEPAPGIPRVLALLPKDGALRQHNTKFSFGGEYVPEPIQKMVFNEESPVASDWEDLQIHSPVDTSRKNASGNTATKILPPVSSIFIPPQTTPKTSIQPISMPLTHWENDQKSDMRSSHSSLSSESEQNVATPPISPSNQKNKKQTFSVDVSSNIDAEDLGEITYTGYLDKLDRDEEGQSTEVGLTSHFQSTSSLPSLSEGANTYAPHHTTDCIQDDHTDIPVALEKLRTCPPDISHYASPNSSRSMDSVVSSTNVHPALRHMSSAERMLYQSRRIQVPVAEQYCIDSCKVDEPLSPTRSPMRPHVGDPNNRQRTALGAYHAKMLKHANDPDASQNLEDMADIDEIFLPEDIPAEEPLIEMMLSKIPTKLRANSTTSTPMYNPVVGNAHNSMSMPLSLPPSMPMSEGYDMKQDLVDRQKEKFVVAKDSIQCGGYTISRHGIVSTPPVSTSSQNTGALSTNKVYNTHQYDPPPPNTSSSNSSCVLNGQTSNASNSRIVNTMINNPSPQNSIGIASNSGLVNTTITNPSLQNIVSSVEVEVSNSSSSSTSSSISSENMTRHSTTSALSNSEFTQSDFVHSAGSEGYCDNSLDFSTDIDNLPNPTKLPTFPAIHDHQTASADQAYDIDLVRLQTKRLEASLCQEDLVMLHGIGKGQHGQVYKSQHLPSLGLVAAKSVNVYNTSSRHQLIKELNAYAKLDNEHIVQLVGAYFDEDNIVLASEYMNLGDLKGLVSDMGPLPECVIMHIARCTLLALQYLHYRNLVHRDIKPDNVLVDSSGKVKVADFGLLAEFPSEHYKTTTFLGTLAYLSPERLASEPYNFLADIWALGLVFYFCATGTAAYEPTSYWDLYDSVRHNPPPRLDETKYSADLCNFIACMLQMVPEDRLSATELLNHPFLAKISICKTCSNGCHCWLRENKHILQVNKSKWNQFNRQKTKIYIDLERERKKLKVLPLYVASVDESTQEHNNYTEWSQWSKVSMREWHFNHLAILCTIAKQIRNVHCIHGNASTLVQELLECELKADEDGPECMNSADNSKYSHCIPHNIVRGIEAAIDNQHECVCEVAGGVESFFLGVFQKRMLHSRKEFILVLDLVLEGHFHGMLRIPRTTLEPTNKDDVVWVRGFRPLIAEDALRIERLSKMFATTPAIVRKTMEAMLEDKRKDLAKIHVELRRAS